MIPSGDSTGTIAGIRSIAKMPSNVCYGSLAPGVMEAAVTIMERANTVAGVWVGEYELLKLSHSGFQVLLQAVHDDAVALTKQHLMLSRECLPSLCQSQVLCVG